MQNNFLKILMLSLLFASCNTGQKSNINIGSVQIGLNDDIDNLQKELKKESITLVYENSYQGAAKDVKYFYFDYEKDSVNYHVDVYTIDDKVKTIEASLFSKLLSEENVVYKVQKDILPKFKESISGLKNVKTASEWVNDKKSGIGYYFFMVKG